MTAEEEAFRKLQEHLNTMPVGFPASQSGVEINLLKEIFTPEEASIATHLDYKHKTVDQIYETAKDDVSSAEELTGILDDIVAKGGITRRERNNQKEYALLPLVVWGMYEHQLKRLSPGFLMSFGQYLMSDFGPEFASSRIPKMRVIPIEESVEAAHAVATYDELRQLIQEAGDHLAIQECICRKVSDLQGKNCQATERREVCMSLGDLADLYVAEGWGRKISQEEALEIARESEEEGLVLMPSNEQEAQFMCACCGDCCQMLGMMKMFPRPADVVASNFYAQVDAELCDGTGICVERCPLDAVNIVEGAATVDLARCIGCGLCVTTCPENALSLVGKAQEMVPPETVGDRMDAMMAEKRARQQAR